MTRLYRLVRENGRSYGVVQLHPDLSVSMRAASHPDHPAGAAWLTPLLAEDELTGAERWQLARFERNLDESGAISAQDLPGEQARALVNERIASYDADLALHRALFALGVAA